jgi:hypothetical protein
LAVIAELGLPELCSGDDGLAIAESAVAGADAAMREDLKAF